MKSSNTFLSPPKLANEHVIHLINAETLLALIALLVLCLNVHAASHENWLQFRGPRASGLSEHPRLGSYMQTPIALEPLLWSCDWYGVLTCGDARTGRLHFSERLGSGGQAFTASPVAAKDKLYFTSEGVTCSSSPRARSFRC